MGWFVVLADVLEEGYSYFFVLRVFSNSRLCGETFETWVSEMEDAMLNCRKTKFLGIQMWVFLGFGVGG